MSGLSWKNFTKSGAQRSDGVIVVRVARNSVKYSEDGRYMLVDVEPGDGPLSIYRDSIRKWSDAAIGEYISAADAERIVSNIREGFAHIGVSVRVE